MIALTLSYAEVMWLTEFLGSLAYWPSPQMAHMPGTQVSMSDDLGGGPDFRARLLGLHRNRDRNPSATTPLIVDCSRQDLWLIDSAIQMQGQSARFIKLSDGQPLVSLQQRVWDGIIADYGDDLPPASRGVAATEEQNGTDGDGTARDIAADNTRRALDALLARLNPDTGAGTDTIRGPGHDEGAATDLPPAAPGGGLGGVVTPPAPQNWWDVDDDGGVYVPA